ncbi:response regulator [Pseudenhygromyxa sp. WMMC2535]|uniref:chemotaxis protein CheB n=1 Tax=Pseudenhygromyxa sp. WMMC2535 TaxID=2712867 RepID=UPI001551AD96|nr:chemotaxis protein CheB [Pseudenhygromyxa sp. WMMC2535]NVB39071.1 response regulator [Pseudenhygromyxa sp. WMMC2535]
MPEETEAGSPFPVRIVGVGASAGGLEALEQLFRAMPEDTGMAFVVVQHLSPDFKSQMDELLSRWTKLEIHIAEHEMPLEPDAIYLMPPNAELIIADGRLLLKERSEGLALPIDQFLRSAARDLGERAVAIILSGTGSDGSRGIREVHTAGGLVMVQSEESAKFNGMPKSAIETGMADYVGAPRDLPEMLLRHFDKHRPLAEGATDPAEAVKLGGMRAVFALLHERYNIDFSAYKPGTIGRRTERRLMINQSENLSEYIERLRSDRSELDALYQDLLIGVTGFFRDAEAFDLLEREILPQLVSEANSGRELRMWAAGCATGEEAYSLALLTAEAIERSGRTLTAKIFATDVHRSSLDYASAGIYPEAELTEVGQGRLERFFSREEHGYRVSAELRRMIVFTPHNVIRDAPFTKLDLVSCRNLLIYFQPTVQRKVMSLFHFGLRTGGVLFLGPSETPGDLGDEFEPIDQHWKMFRKRRDVRLLPGLRGSHIAAPIAPVLSSRTPSNDSPLFEVFSGLLDMSLPPSVLLDAHHQVVHSFGDITPLLRLPRGRPSLSLLDMLEGELKLATAGALHRAARSRAPVSFTGVNAGTSFSDRVLDIRVTPVEVTRMAEPFFLVSIGDSSEPPALTRIEDEALDLDAVSRDRLEALEHELQRTKENLQATIEELEASNEELQATNEELLASNEELQSTNEELHSVNEELYTVNAEFQHKIGQLTELTDDMNNLLVSTEVHTLFLDNLLCIRKFTPAMAEVFNLRDGDIGRPIEGFAHNISIENLGDILTRTRDSGQRYEAEVESRLGPFLLRVLPYRGRRGAGGVVVTLIDITKLREAEQALRQQIQLRDRFLAMLSHELRNPLAAVNNALTLVDRRLPESDDGQLRRPLALIARQSRHMQRLLDDLLDVSRVTQGKIHLRKQVFDLCALARDATEQFRVQAREREQNFSVELCEQLWINGDNARILQILDNLLTNAVKYTQRGGNIRFQLTAEGDQAKIIVRDDGAGIDTQTRAQIFDMFMQADTTLDRSQGGLGVGLTLVHNLVELHGGHIEVHSEGLGQGSEFVVTLPRVPAPNSLLTEAAITNAPHLGPTKLALVEDRPEIRETLAELLRDDGYQVFTASNGQAGLELIRKERPDVAVLDIGLPGIDGYELARRLRDDPATRKLPLIAMTGYGRGDDRESVRAAGFDEHLVKPVDVNEVIAALRRLGQS